MSPGSEFAGDEQAIRAYFAELFGEPLASSATAAALARFEAVPGHFSGDYAGAEECLLEIANATAAGKRPAQAVSIPAAASIAPEDSRSLPSDVTLAVVAFASASASAAAIALALAIARRRRRTE